MYDAYITIAYLLLSKPELLGLPTIVVPWFECNLWYSIIVDSVAMVENNDTSASFSLLELRSVNDLRHISPFVVPSLLSLCA